MKYTRRHVFGVVAGGIASIISVKLFSPLRFFAGRRKIEVRRSRERGGFNFDWLDTRHTFSFGDYHDERHMGFRSLRVINEDRIAPSKGFPTHPHKDMEIISYLLEGDLEHRDSLGNGSVIRPGEIQKMSAGTGVTHSEFNPHENAISHFLQIWLIPDDQGLSPVYSQKVLPQEKRRDQLCLIAASGAVLPDHCVPLHVDAKVYSSQLREGREISYTAEKGRGIWVQVADGSLRVEGHDLEAGDGMSLENVESIVIQGRSEAHFLLFDLA